jgi:hypothetical protein
VWLSFKSYPFFHLSDFKGKIMRYLLILICVILVSCVAPVSVSGDRYIVLSPEIAELLYFFGVSD